MIIRILFSSGYSPVLRSPACCRSLAELSSGEGALSLDILVPAGCSDPVRLLHRGLCAILESGVRSWTENLYHR